MFQIGDPVPWFISSASNNPQFSFSSLGGLNIILCFFGAMKFEKSKQAIEFFTHELRDYFDDENFAFFGVTIDPTDQSSAKVVQQIPGIYYFWDFNKNLSKLYGAIDREKESSDYKPFTLILDPMLRVMANIPLENVESHNKEVTNFLAQFSTSRFYKELSHHPPILILPRVFEPDFCKKLIDIYESHESTPSGFMREKDGYTTYNTDPTFKKRRDFILTDDPNLQPIIKEINNSLIRHLVPEIKKSFQFKVTRIERYLVACYDAVTGGFFRAHRDNTTKGTAHRRFAVTINLNAGEYEGGDLRFPEFGKQTYRAPTGGAVVFSCSLLHEATLVTEGTRYAFLPFLYDDEAAKIRAENLKYILPNS